MSPNVGNFVHDLVEMAKATEQLPLIEAEANRLKADNDAKAQTIADREERILKLKSEIEELQGKIRTAEAARDDAEYRFLELDEKAHKVLAQVAAITSAAEAVKVQLEPPKPEPLPEPKPEQGQSEAHPIHEDTATPAMSPASPAMDVNTPTNNAMNTDVGRGEGQSEAHPTASEQGGTSVPSGGATTPTVEPQGNANTQVTEGQSAPNPTSSVETSNHDQTESGSGSQATGSEDKGQSVGYPTMETTENPTTDPATDHTQAGTIVNDGNVSSKENVGGSISEPGKYNPYGAITSEWYKWFDKLSPQERNDYYNAKRSA